MTKQPARHGANTIDAIAETIRGLWGPDSIADGELAAMAAETRTWSDLRHLVAAVTAASRIYPAERPAVAWLLSEARRRWRVAEAQQAERASGQPMVCRTCRGSRWVDARVADGAWDSHRGGLVACPDCQRVTNELQVAGAYGVDNPGSGSPKHTATLRAHGYD